MEAQAPAAAEDASPLERQVMEVWQQVLGVTPPSRHANFFELGGKSLQAIQVANRLAQRLSREVAVSALFSHSTVAALAQALSAPAAHRPPSASEGQEFAPLLTIQPGALPALFCLHPAEGLSWCYLGLAKHLPGVAIYGLQATGITGDKPASFDAMVADYVARVREVQPQGPYRLLGWSLGGGLAQAMAAQLRAAGETVELAALMDSYPPTSWQGRPQPTLHDALVTVLSVNGEVDADENGQSLDNEAIYQRLLRPGARWRRWAAPRWNGWARPRCTACNCSAIARPRVTTAMCCCSAPASTRKTRPSRKIGGPSSAASWNAWSWTATTSA